MSVAKYNYTCGWKHNAFAKQTAYKKQGLGSFIMSLLTALVIVLVVAQILAMIDHRIQYKTFQGYSLNDGFSVTTAHAAHDRGLNGYILLQVEAHGEAWYVNPTNGQRYFLGRPDDAFRIMRELGLGVSNKDIAGWKGYAPARLAGKIVLQVESKGEAYYIHPKTLKLHFLGRPADAFEVMRKQGLGITNTNLAKVTIQTGYDLTQKTSSVTPQPTQPVPLFSYCQQNKYFIATVSQDKKCSEIELASFEKIGATPEQMIQYYTSVGRHEDAQRVRDQVKKETQQEQEVVTPVITQPMQVESTTEGPLIRVGMFFSEQAQALKNTQGFEVRDAQNKLLMTVPAQTTLWIDYLEGSKQYAYGLTEATQKTSQYLRFIAPSSSAVFEITTYERRPEWNPSLNDNTFLGNLELRYNSSKNRTWMINELPMETYLKGIAETSNSSPMEYQKAMMIAARTYATYHLERGTKHGDEFFIVDATYDQVYKGYGTQQRLTNVTKAVDATKGLVVTYNGKIAITPYFSWSDGRTRSMKEVWNSDQPWLQSVQEPAGYTKTTLFGHGVGLSAHGALLLASEKYNYTAEQILKYYYTGIDLTPQYNSLFN